MTQTDSKQYIYFDNIAHCYSYVATLYDNMYNIYMQYMQHLLLWN